MIGKGPESERIVAVGEVKEILEKRKKDKELTYEQQLAMEHVEKIGALDEKKAEKLKRALVEMGLSEKSAVKMVDILPKNIMTLKQILATEKKPFSDDEANKMLTLIKENS